jgi:peroxiredoxin
MSAGVGDQVPDVGAYVMSAEGPQRVSTGELLGGGRVVLFAVPGAFTPTCSNVHLPGFVARAGELAGKGVDTVACVSVNDPFVMAAWGAAAGADGAITMIADPDGAFTQAMGLTTDLSAAGLGSRSRRYAAVIEDGVIRNLDVETERGVIVSSCEAVLSRLS